MLIYLLLLAAVIAVGCFTDLFDFKELGAVFTVNMTSLLKLVIMVLVILLAANIIIFVLGCIKPRTHRGGSVLSLLGSLVKYVAGIIIVCPCWASMWAPSSPASAFWLWWWASAPKV